MSDWHNIENNIVWEVDPLNPLIVGYVDYGVENIDRQRYNIVKIEYEDVDGIVKNSYWLDRNIRAEHYFQNPDLPVLNTRFDVIRKKIFSKQGTWGLRDFHPKMGYAYNLGILGRGWINAYGLIPPYTSIPTRDEIEIELGNLTNDQKKALNFIEISDFDYSSDALINEIYLDEPIRHSNGIFVEKQRISIANFKYSGFGGSIGTQPAEFDLKTYSHLLFRRFNWDPFGFFTINDITYDPDSQVLSDWWNDIHNQIFDNQNYYIFTPNNFNYYSQPPRRGRPYCPDGNCDDIWYYIKVGGGIAAAIILILTVTIMLVGADNNIHVGIRCKIPTEWVETPTRQRTRLITDPIFFGSGY